MKKVWHKIRHFGLLFKSTFVQWNERDPFGNSAVIAYYTIFSLPGLLVIIINLAGYFFGEEAITGEISSQVDELVGQDAAKNVETIISNANQTEGSTIASIIGIATLLFGATGVFYRLQMILNEMWEVKPVPKQKFLKLLKDRLFSFGLILVVGFLLLVSLVLSAALSALSSWVSNNLSDSFNIVFKIVDILLSLGVITLLFSAMYKFLPDAEIRWKDVWVGALVTSVLFVIAKFALGLYFGNSDPGSAYGAAGSIILIMLWVTYAGLILLFGAEFTQVYAKTYGVKVRPSEHAISTAKEDRSTRTKSNERDRANDRPGRSTTVSSQDEEEYKSSSR